MSFANSYDLTLFITGRDFVTAGQAASNIKRTLETLNLPPKLVRRATICAYEAEMNIIIHAYGGRMGLRVTEDAIRIGPRMKGRVRDLDQAMEEGHSTAWKKFGNGFWRRHGSS